MGLWDKMFGRGASEAQKAPNAQERFDTLKQKYQSVLNSIDQQHIQLRNLHVQDDKLYVKGVAPSQDAANQVWDQIKLVNPNLDDITVDLAVEEQQTRSMAAGASSGGEGQNTRTYTVRSGDTLSKISRQHYGDADEFMRIFYANRDKMSDPDKIRAGQELVIPPDDNA
ncbi:MAG TPA: LysM peptidoglycan-binding domain-containing protein [Pyrinomonadaceae bacterium]|nr:LysM peptidoglycan-binding domain-containing protein [Pyrinomonadaceae bacterium]